MKTKNYLGRQDENRGIIAFLIIFVIVIVITIIILCCSKLKSKGENMGISSIDEMYYELEKTSCEINTFDIKDGKLILSGELTENVNQNLLSKLDNVQLVLKNKDGDKYSYDLDYFISIEGIEFSTINDENNEEDYLVQLDNIDAGEYFVFLRTKTESSKVKEGYIYKYYTLENTAENNELNYGNMKILFDKSNKVEQFLTIIKK